MSLRTRGMTSSMRQMPPKLRVRARGPSPAVEALSALLDCITAQAELLFVSQLLPLLEHSE